MKKLLESFNLKKPLHSLFPWRHLNKYDNLEFRNLPHFINTVGQLTQKDDSKCGVTYARALTSLQRKESNFPKEEQESIRNLVRSNLHKRGLITEEVYENFRYATEGTQVGIDIGKYAAGEPDCVITPSRQYVDFFHELFISVSYSYMVTDADIRKNTAKLLAAVEELERQHIFIKITLVLPIGAPAENTLGFFSSIPLFHHKEPKSVNTMSAIVNERLLREFYFALLEGLYEDELFTSYGQAQRLDTAMSLGDEFDEIEFFESMQEKVGIK